MLYHIYHWYKIKISYINENVGKMTKIDLNDDNK
jgi:hypothetical protein